jgi:hypothetical protein
MSALVAAALVAAQLGVDIVPSQFHLALAGPSAVRVAWKTVNATSASSCSFWPAGVPNSNASAMGSAREYLPDFGFHHVALLAPLEAATPYTYTCGDGAAAMSPPRTFTSAPAAGSSTPTHWVIFGDWGFGNSTTRPTIPVGGLDANWTATFTQTLLDDLVVGNSSVDGVWIVGDIAYADDAFGHVGELLNFGYEAVYDGFMGAVEPYASTKPLHVSAGNHGESGTHSQAHGQLP